MSISAGFSGERSAEFVLNITGLPYGQKGPWLAAQGVLYHRLRRWRAAVFEGDLDRGLIPREGSRMTIPQPSGQRWRRRGYAGSARMKPSRAAARAGA